MNEPAALPPPDTPEGPAQQPTAPVEHRPRRDLLPVLCALGFLLLAGAIAYVWTRMVPADQLANQARDVDAVHQQVDTVNQRVSDLDAKLNQLTRQPPPVSPADMAKLSARVDALDGKLADQTQLASRVDTVSGRIEALSNRDQSALDAINRQVSDLDGQVKAAQGAVGNLSAVSTRLDRIAKLQQAAFALSAGQPVGDVPGAPAALLKYAQNAPPTEAQLRLSFSQAQARALTSPQPNDTAAPFVDRVLERAQGLLTVRSGNQVVVGDTTAMALDKAQTALNAGDLAGAVTAVEGLKGDPAQAMAAWLANAKGLVDARAALLQMADHTS